METGGTPPAAGGGPGRVERAGPASTPAPALARSLFGGGSGQPLPEVYVAFDCETTGLDPARDALLQLAAVAVTPEGRREWATLIDPGRPIDLQISRLTGITSDRLRGAPPAVAALTEFRSFVADLPLVAHNATFDLAFVEAGLGRHRLRPIVAPVYDTLELARWLAPSAPSHRLEDLVRIRGLDAGRAHDALEDARSAAALFASLLEELGGLEPRLLRTMGHFLHQARGPLARMVAAYCGGAGLPSLVQRALAPVRPRERPERVAADEADAGHPPAAAAGALTVGELLRPESPLAQRLQPFEVRPSQARMLEAVARALSGDRHLIVEAGTGTGKSLAYLLPAMAWALERGERVVVATQTVNLQEQLVEKDLPLISGSGVLTGEVALQKGRGQYACLKLWEERLQPQIEVDPADAAFLARFSVWLAQTETGDRGELALYGEDEERFGVLSADAVACTGRRCPHFDPCFLFRARRKAERADVIVANHALVFADINAAGGVLPEYGYLICDEAHHLEDQASNHLGRVVGERAVERFWRLLERPAGIGRQAGLLPTLRLRLDGPGAADGSPVAPAPGAAARESLASRQPGSSVRSRLDDAAGALRAGRQAALLYFEGLRAWAAGRGISAQNRAARFEPRPADGADARWDEVRGSGADLARALKQLGEALDGLAAALDDGSPDAEADAETLVAVRGLAVQAGEMAADVDLCLRGQEGWVTWCEIAQTRSGGPGAAVVRGCPINPGELLRRNLFGQKRAVVMTSATLTVGRKAGAAQPSGGGGPDGTARDQGPFAYVRGRLGLGQGEEAARTDELLLPSPFDFRSQALLGVPTDTPNPSRSRDDPQGYLDAIAPLLVGLLVRSRGHALLLFTANRAMRLVRDRLKPELEAEGIACLAQGVDGSRGALTAALRRNEETVVLGSASFWEGVDVQGEALRCLVIAQLPFWPPDVPLRQARQESVAARGGSPFRDLQLPEAVLRFKQGFGRLIRSTSDRGVAIVLDPRLATADYRRAFLASLPGAGQEPWAEAGSGPELIIAPGRQVLARAARWLAT